MSEPEKLSSVKAIRKYLEGEYGGFKGRPLKLEELKPTVLSEPERMELASLACKAMGDILVDSTGHPVSME